MVQYFGRRIHERFERIQAMFSDISARAQENFSGARLIRAYVQEEAEIENFETDNREYIARSLKLVRLMGMLWPTLETLLGFAIIIVLYVGGREVLQHRIGLGSFVAFNTYMVQLTWPIIALGWVINIFQRGTASMGRIHNILSEPPEITDAGVRTPFSDESSNGDPRRHRVPQSHFRYGNTIKAAERGNGRAHGDEDVLKNVNLRVPAGTSLAIVGPTGSGKSTLVSLIPRIYDAEPGHGADRRTPDSRVPARAFAPQHRLRAAGDISVQRHHPREHCLRRGRRRASMTFAAPPKRPTSPPTSKAFPMATTPSSASAA